MGYNPSVCHDRQRNNLDTYYEDQSIPMPRITIDGKFKDLEEGEPILSACEALGVPFGCQAGSCGTCVIVVESGMDNLHPMNHLEEDMGLRGNERLACQARIKGGEVVATW